MQMIIVDSHKEALPYWFKEYLKIQRPVVIVRIDKHHDMNHDCPALPATEGRQNLNYLAKMMPYILEYTKEEINEGNFTCPAFHHGIVGALYHFNPRENDINAYGRVCGQQFIDVPKTKKEAKSIGGKRCIRIVWDGSLTKLRIYGGKPIPNPQKIKIGDFRKDIDGCGSPIVIDFDLDAIYEIGEKNPAKEVVGKRLEKAKHVLECISSPLFACISRSQTPRAYVPPEMVDSIQEAVNETITDFRLATSESFYEYAQKVFPGELGGYAS
jgi:hypothetical protein